MCIRGTDPWQSVLGSSLILGERVEPFVHSDTRTDQHFKNPRKKPFGHHHHWQGMLTELVALRNVWEKTLKNCDQNWGPKKMCRSSTLVTYMQELFESAVDHVTYMYLKVVNLQTKKPLEITQYDCSS